MAIVQFSSASDHPSPSESRQPLRSSVESPLTAHGESCAETEGIENPETTMANSIIPTICFDAMRTGLFEH